MNITAEYVHIICNDRFFHFCPIVDLKEKNLLLILMEDSEMNLSLLISLYCHYSCLGHSLTFLTCPTVTFFMALVIAPA